MNEIINDPNIFYLSEYIFLLKFEKLLLILVYFPSNDTFNSLTNIESLELSDHLSAPLCFKDVCAIILDWKVRHSSSIEVSYFHPILNLWKPIEKFSTDSQKNDSNKYLVGFNQKLS